MNPADYINMGHEWYQVIEDSDGDLRFVSHKIVHIKPVGERHLVRFVESQVVAGIGYGLLRSSDGVWDNVLCAEDCSVRPSKMSAVQAYVDGIVKKRQAACQRVAFCDNRIEKASKLFGHLDAVGSDEWAQGLIDQVLSAADAASNSTQTFGE